MSWPLVAEFGLIVILGYAGAIGLRDTDSRAYAAGYRANAATWTRGMRDFATPSRVVLAGNDTLVVGDSMMCLWPWPADRVSLWGHPTPNIRAEFEAEVVGRRYKRIILWPGTAHFESGYSVTQYVEDVVAMVAHARPQCDQLVLIAPLPRDAAANAAAEAVAALAAAAPDVPIIQLNGWRARAVATGRWPEWTTDGLHLNRAGLAHLRLALDSSGMDPAVFAEPPRALARR